MTIFFPCEISFLLKYLQEEKVFFSPIKSAKLILWGFLNGRGRLVFQEHTLTHFRSVCWTSCHASCPAGWAVTALPPSGLQLHFIGRNQEKKNPQTSFEMFYIIKSHLGCDCFWLKQGASLNGIKENSSCLEILHLSASHWQEEKFNHNCIAG